MLRHGCLKLISGVLLIIGGNAAAQGLFPVGGENKSKGMESALAARRGSAVLYNPANLALAPDGQHPYVEIGYANVNYAYEHPKFDPVIVRSNTPTVTLGYSTRLSKRWHLGAVFAPERYGQTKIPGVPQQIGDETYSVAVTDDHRVFNSGLGLAYKVHRRFQVGLSILHTYEREKSTASLVGNEGTNLLEQDVHAQYFRPRVGGHLTRKNFRVVGTYMPKQEIFYSGRTVTAFNLEDTVPRQRRFEPAVVGTGVGLKWDSYTAQMDVNYKQWSQGRDVYRSALAFDETHADLNDVLERGVSFSYRHDPRHKLTLGASYLPTPWGPGHDDGTPAGHVEGMTFGDFSGITRRSVAAGTSVVMGKQHDRAIDFAVYHSRGVREVRTTFDNAGFYQVDMTVISTTVTANF